MNYQRIYDEFIADRRLKEEQLTGYTEKHHILPRSLGGDNSKENLIRLTAQDHYFAHSLLAKIHGDAMWRAFWMMSNSKRYKTSRLMYEQAKKKQSAFASMLAKKHLKGREKTPEEIEKIRLGLKSYYSKNPVEKGIKKNLTEDIRKAMSERTKAWIAKNGHPLKGKRLSPEHVEKIKEYMGSDRNHFKGKPMPAEQRKKIGAAQVGKLNHAYKKQVYLFNHPIHGDFIGTQNKLMHEFKLLKNGVSRLCRREFKQHKGWVIVKEISVD